MKTLSILFFLLICLNLSWANGLKDPPWSTATAADVTLNYRITDEPENIDCQLIAATTGWVAVGFAPVLGMQAANFIIGYHLNGNTFIRDDYGTSSTTHSSDTSLSGTNNIVLSSSTEVAGVTQLNFKIPLNSGDTFDKVLVVGNTYNIILGRGYNGGDSFTSSHAAVGSTIITVPDPVSVQDDFIQSPLLTITSYPNPFGTRTNISFKLNTDSKLGVAFYNTKGQLVRTLPKALYNQGENTLNWDGRDNQGKTLPEGIYFLRITGSGINKTHKLIHLKNT